MPKQSTTLDFTTNGTNGDANGHQNGDSAAGIAAPNGVIGNGHSGWTPGFRSANKPEKALKFARRYTVAGQDPFETAQWEKRTAAITGETGKAVFEQKDCEIPKDWSW
jgi:ribonucleoside-diphosphate reductase alpha chain